MLCQRTTFARPVVRHELKPRIVKSFQEHRARTHRPLTINRADDHRVWLKNFSCFSITNPGSELRERAGVEIVTLKADVAIICVSRQ